jgi:hypothetical protein
MIYVQVCVCRCSCRLPHACVHHGLAVFSGDRGLQVATCCIAGRSLPCALLPETYTEAHVVWVHSCW